MKRFFTFLLFSLLISACCVSFQYKTAFPISLLNAQKYVLIDDGLTPEERNDIELGFKNWECSTKGLVHITFLKDFNELLNRKDYIFVEKVDNTDARIIAQDKFYDKEQERKYHTLAVYYDGTNSNYSVILVVENRTKYNLKQVITHEVGHSVLLSHDKQNKDTVMYPFTDEGATKITDKDLENFCDLYWCDPKELNACNI